MEFSGVVVSGKGEGSHYVEEYNKLFSKRLGKSFFPGTFNIRTSGVSFPDRFISISPGGKLREVRCYEVVLNALVECFAVVPQVTNRDPDVIELMCESNIREKLKLRDGDTVMLRFKE